MSVSIDNEKCEGCGICVPLCPVHAISILNGKAFIDQNRCTDCLQCINECPNDAIRQISDKELSLETRESSIPIFEDRSIPQQRHKISGNKQSSRLSETRGFFLDELKRAIHNFFQPDPSLSMSQKNKRRKYGRQRRRRRGGKY
jgi:Fe-S-cluster-containing hydrogenase component 2